MSLLEVTNSSREIRKNVEKRKHDIKDEKNEQKLPVKTFFVDLLDIDVCNIKNTSMISGSILGLLITLIN
jgi:hypothetical protein